MAVFYMTVGVWGAGVYASGRTSDFEHSRRGVISDIEWPSSLGAVAWHDVVYANAVEARAFSCAGHVVLQFRQRYSIVVDLENAWNHAAAIL